jgi:hypothetical protein
MGLLPGYNTITASAKILPPSRKFNPQYESWQDEVWEFFDNLGEFEAAVSWKANAMSRVRLIAAELQPGGQEPIPIEEGPAVDAVSRLAGGTGGQSALMREMTIHLSVPGEGWLVGEHRKDGEEVWFIASADELRVSNKMFEGQRVYEIREGDSERSWRQLSVDAIVVRFWNPDPRRGWRATSSAKHARVAMRKIDLTNKRIIATILSRLASNGVILYDKGKLSFPTPNVPESVDKPDPFAAMLVDIASNAIEDPYSPGACIPLPIGFDLGDVAGVDPEIIMRYLRFDGDLSDKLLENYTMGVKQLATSLDIPSEIVLGLGDVNHWTAWQIEESAIKIHIAPVAESISHSLSVGYLTPSLRANGNSLTGPNGGRIVIWYDPSEITVRPDLSTNTIRAYDRMEAKGEALRRELGLNEDDRPDDNEFRDLILKKMAQQPQLMLTVLQEFGGIAGRALELNGNGQVTLDDLEDERGTPDTRDAEPPSPDDDVPGELHMDEDLENV